MGLARLTVVLLVLMVLLYACWPERVLRHPPGPLVTTVPVQGPAPARAPWKHKEFDIRPLATFKLDARVLAKSYYWFDAESTISPYDLALGWGEMSDQSVIDTMTISQSSRWYFTSWYGKRPPIGDDAIGRQSANMHMIPANDKIARRIAAVKVGQVVTIEGMLIEATYEQWRWTSSMTRDDRGRGACEVVWVEAITARDR